MTITEAVGPAPPLRSVNAARSNPTSESCVSLSTTRAGLSGTLDNTALGEEGRSLLSRVLELLDAATRRWPDWAECAAPVPEVLTHGAFVSRNVRMRGVGSTLTTLPFDWDHVAVRSPAIDLARTSRPTSGFGANASLKRYQDMLEASGLALGRNVVGTVATLGTVIRAATCIGWLITSLASEHVRRPLAEIQIYRHALEGALRS